MKFREALGLTWMISMTVWNMENMPFFYWIETEVLPGLVAFLFLLIVVIWIFVPAYLIGWADWSDDD